MDTTQIVQQVAAEAAQHPEISSLMLFVVGLLGILFHYVKKAKKLQIRAGYNFDLNDFVKHELLSFMLSMIVLATAIICQGNIAALRVSGYVLGNFMYPAFFVIGYAGESIVDWAMGGYEAKLKKGGKI